MRVKLYFDLENEHFPIQYRKSMMSFIKKSLSEYCQEYYDRLYHERDTIIKPFTFAIFLHSPEFKENEILVKDKRFEMSLSIQDYEIGIILYNALNHQKHVRFSLHQNSWVLQRMDMLQEKEINTDTIDIKFLSPLVVRSRVDKKDFYYSFEAEEFLEILKINIREELKIANFPKGIENTFEMKPIQAKKVIVKFYEKKIECSIGSFQISGDKKLLTYLYQAGMGSKKSCGFGMFDII